MKRKGFTLIELLAVIVILAVIALITVPLLIGIVDKAKIGALKDSAYGLIESADLYYAQNMGKLEGYTKIEIQDGKQISENKLEYKGKIDGDGIVIISKEGKVQLCLTNDNIYVKKEFDETEITIEEMTSDVTCNIPNEEDGDFSMSIVGSSSNYYDKETIDLKLDEIKDDISEINNSLNQLIVEEQTTYSTSSTSVKTLKTITNLENGVYIATLTLGGSGNGFLVGSIKKNGQVLGIQKTDYGNSSSPRLSLVTIFSVIESDIIEFVVQSSINQTSELCRIVVVKLH